MKKEKHVPRMPNTLTKGKEKNIALCQETEEIKRRDYFKRKT